jgi:predicted nucleic acid-binding protein
MAKNVIADTGFWFALYEPRDIFYKNANEIAGFIKDQNVLVPWPSLYETINSRFAKRKDYMRTFEIFINKSNVSRIPDEDYRDRALELAFEYSRVGKRTFSLVDIILREILLDDSYKIDYLLTFNTGDFIDVCNKRKIEIHKF